MIAQELISLKRFIAFGYLYGVFGILGTFCVTRNILAVIRPKYPVLAMVPVVIWFIMYVVFMVGIKRKNISLLRMYRIFLITTNVFSLIVIMLCVLILLATGRLPETELIFGQFLVILLSTAVGFTLGLWILNGLIRYINYTNYNKKTDRKLALQNATIHLEHEPEKQCDPSITSTAMTNLTTNA